MNRIKNNSFPWLCLLGVGTILLVGSCASIQGGYHAYVMRGSIVDTSGSHVYLCIGSNDGASVGQELYMYKITQASTSSTGQITREGRVPRNPVYSKQFTGKVKIIEIVDEHFAKAEVISGRAEQNDIVELVTPGKR